MKQSIKEECKASLNINGKEVEYYSLKLLSKKFPSISKLPFSLKILLENLLRNYDGENITENDIENLSLATSGKAKGKEISFQPARVLMQDFTGVPGVVDLAAMRDAINKLGLDPKKINPQSPVDLVIDHSVMVDYSGNKEAFKKNVKLEYDRNIERYKFLKWGSETFDNFRVVPPGTGICHQVNLEYLAKTIWRDEKNGKTIVYPDTLVGTDSHTTMVNAMAVLGWGVGGIEAEAAMLGQPISMLIPDVVGFKIKGSLSEGITATDLVLRIVEILRSKGVVGKFVEFSGEGLNNLSLADRATIANMAPEYGATCGFFPVDNETLNYLRLTGRDNENIELVKKYTLLQEMKRDENLNEIIFDDLIELDLKEIKPALAGPKRPQDRVLMEELNINFRDTLTKENIQKIREVKIDKKNYSIKDGDIAIAAITSCTNTSNPSVLIAAGLLARNALNKGLKVKEWVKTSLAPGSKVVSEYLNSAGLQKSLDDLGFNLVGYGCTTCIGNSGSLDNEITEAIIDNNLVVCSVLSGNRNFEGRISPYIRSNYLASPPLVVAYALVGNVDINLNKDPLGIGKDGSPVYLRDIWPRNDEISAIISDVITPSMFVNQYSSVFDGDEKWKSIDQTANLTYDWDPSSTYVKNPPYFSDFKKEPEPIKNIINARALAILGDSVTTDHISPAGSILSQSPAGEYLSSYQINEREYNSYGSRRGNHEVMMRGTFANNRLTNLMAPNTSGGITIHYPSNEKMSIYKAAMKYKEENIPLIVFGGKEYGTGSSRDWAAKGTMLLGVKAVIAKSFERIHRSNLIGMGILPLELNDDIDLRGNETFDIIGLEDEFLPKSKFTLIIKKDKVDILKIELSSRVDTIGEADYFKNGGILPYVLRKLAS